MVCNVRNSLSGSWIWDPGSSLLSHIDLSLHTSYPYRVEFSCRLITNCVCKSEIHAPYSFICLLVWGRILCCSFYPHRRCKNNSINPQRKRCWGQMLPVGTQLFPDEIIAVLHSIPNYDLDASGAESMTANQLVIEENMGGSVAERVAGVITTHTTGFSASIEQTSDIGIQPVLGISPPPPQPPRFIKAPALATLQPVIQAVVQPQVTIPSFTIPPPQLMMQQPVVPAVVMGSIPPMYQQQQQQQQFQQVGYQYYQPMHMQQQQMQPQLGMPQYPMGMNMMTPGMSPYGQLPMLIPPPVVGDPMNDMSSWSEHESEDKRKYWYNRVNGTSTYDKPFCLKTPEERSIPHCKWKEYTSADDKKYYSDGKESRYLLLVLLLSIDFHNFIPSHRLHKIMNDHCSHYQSKICIIFVSISKTTAKLLSSSASSLLWILFF